MDKFKNLPQQKLSFKKKGVDWRKQHLDWADNKVLRYDSSIRKSIKNKKINYNLVNGILDIEDIELILNPESIKANYIPDNIQHYPIINSKLNILRGEELQRYFKPRVIITNPNAISEIENNKKEEWLQKLSQWITSGAKSEEEANKELEKISDYFTYEWQDIREQRANFLLNHYIKEFNLRIIFNNGFMDALIAGEEIYQCDIISGEPYVEKINPNKIHVLKSGYSNRIEDADMILLWDYWSPGKVIDTYYDILTDDDVDKISNLPYTQSNDSMYNIDETKNLSYLNFNNVTSGEGVIFEGNLFDNNFSFANNYVDHNGNIRVIRLYWKSFRKIKKIKSYNLETGEEEFNFYTEEYIPNKQLGEEEEILWINEAWEGTKIGKDIYVNMRPKLVQYNRLSNPSKCHFGIIGSLYNLNDSNPYTLVDIMKPYNYLYDVIHDRFNKSIASNWGKILKVDLATVPAGWKIEQWLHYAKINKIAVTDSFKEGNKGISTGKLAGMMNNQSSGVIDAETGNYIQHHVDLLEFIKMEMSEVAGITRQREGQISNRETVGGIERATLQSSHITEWYYSIHEDVKVRFLTCLLETAKVALKGKSLKFKYILSDGTDKIIDIPGDEFAECDYGLVVENSSTADALIQKFDMLAQAMLQNQMITASSLIKIYSDISIAEMSRIIRTDEKEIQERNSQAQQAQQEQFQAELEMKTQFENEKLNIERENNIRDNETKLLIAQVNAEAKDLVDEYEPEEYSQKDKDLLAEKIRQFNKNVSIEEKKLVLQEKKLKEDKNIKMDELKIKEKQISKNNNKTN